MGVSSYNIRVYGLLFKNQEVLITHENRANMLMTKFPGGGLEKGEGLADGLKREFQEELQLEISVGELFYVNEFLQLSQFDQSEQLISFYYKVNAEQLNGITTQAFSREIPEDGQIFEWRSIERLDTNDFTFPVDRVVVERLSQSF